MSYHLLSFPLEYELFSHKEDSLHLEEGESKKNQNEEKVFFNLTAPDGHFDEKGLQRMRQHIPRKKIIKEKLKTQVNPFYNKLYWDKFLEAERNGEENIRFPGIGIERTPLYEIQQAEIEKEKKKKEML